MVFFVSSVSMMSATGNSFHALIAVIMQTVTMPGFAIGTITLRRTPKFPQPSIMAASS